MRRRAALSFLSLLLFAALAGCIGGEIPTETNEHGETIGPAWSFTDTDGVTHSRDSTMGNASILFFMATWCSSCRGQTGPLANVNAAYSDQGLAVYSLTFDPTETNAHLDDWKARYDQPWPHGVDTNREIAQTFRITQQSSLVILDHKGLPVEVFGFPGATESSLQRAVAAALDRQEA